MNTQKKVVTRIPPSPTGPFHIGTARTALFNYLFAKHHDGEFLVRFEDTDRERSEQAFERDIVEGLEWLGLSFSTPVRQSERVDLHKKELERLVEAGAAYHSEEAHPETGKKSTVVRFKNTHSEPVVFNDAVRGDIATDISDLGDFIIGRGDGSVLYNFAVVVDDNEQGVTHILRGDDHISNTPRQVALQGALGYERPVYAHFPLIHGTDGKKLSKRTGAFSVLELRETGYLPEAVVNYLVTLGWTPRADNDEELFTLEELAACFSLKNISMGRAVFDEKKLQWFNKQYFQKQSSEEVLTLLSETLTARFNSDSLPSGLLSFVVSDIQERFATVREGETAISNGEYDFVFKTPETLDTEALKSAGGKISDLTVVKQHLGTMCDILEEMNQWDEQSIRNALFLYADTHGRGAVLWPFRYALTGLMKSPEGVKVATALGKQEAINRLRQALSAL